MLFLYSDQFGPGSHVSAIREMFRVAAEVRVFPLLELGSTPSRHLGQVIDTLEAEGYPIGVTRVDYEFQGDGNQMPRVAHS